MGSRVRRSVKGPVATDELDESVESHGKAVQEEGACSLCGLPVGRSRVQHVIREGEVLRFCCSGCRHVFEILFNSPDGPPSDFRRTELYRACVKSGLIPGDQEALHAILASEEEDHQGTALPSNTEQEEDLVQELTFRVDGMWCTACSWLIEHTLGNTKGIVDSKVFFLSDLAWIKYLPHRVDPADVLSRISSLGYRASLIQDESESTRQRRNLLVRLGISAILTFNAMMISFVLYWGFLEDIGQEATVFISYTIFVLATPTVFYGGYPIFKRALVGVRYGSASMDTLIAVGSLSAYGYSVVQMMQGSLHLYFDTASMLVTLVLLGKYIEIQAREKISTGITELYRLAGCKVRLPVQGRERWVASDAVEVGQEFRVLAGERIPIDGIIVSGHASIDESAMTGESRPVGRSPGNEVMGGTLLLEGDLLIRAIRVGAESSLNQVITLMQEALVSKNPIEQFADRITRRLVPLILLLAAGTGICLVHTGISTDEALLRAVTILVITCPCALGIATPLAKVASLGVGRSKGILVRDSAALENIRNLDVIVFDKTGTLTEGDFTLREIITAEEADRDEALRMVASVEVHSDHFLAREIVRKAGETHIQAEEVIDFEFFEGLGIKGTLVNRAVLVGNRRLMDSHGIEVPPSIDQEASSREAKGLTVVFFGWSGRVQGILIFGDRLKESAERLIPELRSRGVTVWMISGDSQATTQAVAAEVGIENFAGQALPGDKLQLVRQLQEQGHRVGMIGDGINDAAALAQADVGFALGSGANILQEASDITLLSHDPAKVLDSMDLALLSSKVVRQNLFFAFVYNAFGIPLAIMGMITPVLAVIAMIASSLTVICNTLHIARK